MENTEKVYTQAEVDAITERVKQNQQTKLERNYVSRDEFSKLETQYNDLVKANKSQGIKGAFMNLGGLESSFDDVLALNPNLLNIEDTNQLNSELTKIKENKPYFFDNVYRPVQNNDNVFNPLGDDSSIMKNMLKAKPTNNLSRTIVAIEGTEDESEHFN